MLPEFKHWLCKSKTGDQDKAFCKFCNRDVQPNISKLKNHKMTQKHQQIENERGANKKVTSLFKAKEKVVTQDQIRKRREVSLAIIAACTSTFRGLEPVAHFVNREFGNGTVKIARTKTAALIKKVIGPYFSNKLKVRLMQILNQVFLMNLYVFNEYI